MDFDTVHKIATTSDRSPGARNQSSQTRIGLTRTISRLSSGLRIGSAADGASSRAIADRSRADFSTLKEAARSANVGISVVQVADGALAQISNLLPRAVALSEQAASDASGPFGSSAKAALNSEYREILSEIDRISDTTAFDGRGIFVASGVRLAIQVGTGSAPSETITIATSSLSAVGLGLNAIGAGRSVATSALDTDRSTALAEIGSLGTAIGAISARRATLASSLNRLLATAAVVSSTSRSLQAAAAEGQIRNADAANGAMDPTGRPNGPTSPRYQALSGKALLALARPHAP